MSTAQRPAAGTAPAEVPAAGSPWKFSVEQYHRMGEAGVFGPDDRVELIGGEIVATGPIGGRHGSVNKRLVALLTGSFGARALVSVNDPIVLDDQTEPQPDFALLRPRDDYYRSNHPEAADVYLVIEVMDSSAPFDRGTKLPRYARAGVPEVWLVDLTDERIETFRNPRGGRYDEKQTRARGEHIAPGAFPEIELTVDAILG